VERGAKLQPYMVAEAGDIKRMLQADTSEDLAWELTWSAALDGRPAVVELAYRI
jgi:hypothetical protein